MGTGQIATPAVGEVTETTLENGLKVLLKEAHTSPLVSVWCWYKVGSKDEAPGATGISHYCEHINFKGTENFPKEDVKGLIERKGGSWNGYTWIDQTCYLSTLSRDGLDLILRLEADRMHRCLYDDEEILAERTVIISELEGGENNPEEVLDREVVAAAYRAHPYKWPTIGWRGDLDLITPDMLREYYRRHYVPNNATLVVVGDFDTKEALGRIEEHFGSIPRGEEPRRVGTVEPPQVGERRVMVEREGEATYLQIAYHAPAVSDPDAHAYLLLDGVLSGGKGVSIWSGEFDRTRKSSRLYRRLVDGNLAARASSSFVPAQHPYLHTFLFTIKEGVEPAAVEAAFDEEVERLIADGPTEREFEKAVKQVRAAMVLGADSVTKVAHELGFFETIHDHRWYLDFLPSIGSVTRDDVTRVAKQYLRKSNRTVGLSAPSLGKGADAPPVAGHGHHVRSPAYHHRPDGSGDPRVPAVAASPGEAGAAPAAGAAAAGVSPTRHVLPNGLVAILQENPLTPSVCLSIRLATGAGQDPRGKTGRANLAAKLLDAGTTSKSKADIAELVDSTGAAMGIGADSHSVDIHVSSLGEDLPTILSLVSDLAREPVFPQEEIDRMRDRLLLAIREERDDTRSEADRGLREAIYPEGHPYRYPVIGYEDDVKGLLRDDLVAFQRETFTPKGATLVLVGDFRQEEARRLIEEHFVSWQTDVEPPSQDVPDVPWLERPVETIIPMRNKTQADVAFGCRGIRRQHPDYYPVSLMNMILGRFGMGGRLGQNIREEKGLAYYAYSVFWASLGPGPFAVRVGANPKGVEPAVEAIRAEIRRIQDELVTEEELQEVKDYLVGSLPRAIETNQGIASQIQAMEFFELGLDYLQRYPEYVRAVTREQVQEAARKHIDPNGFALAIAGPWEGSVLK